MQLASKRIRRGEATGDYPSFRSNVSQVTLKILLLITVCSTAFVAVSVPPIVHAQESKARNQAPSDDADQSESSAESATPGDKQIDLGGDSWSWVRLKYDSAIPSRRSRWATDYPDADLNLTARIAKVTNLNVDREPLVLEPDTVADAEHPIVYVSANGDWFVSDDDARSLRRYLESGGFLWIDDSWGDREKAATKAQIAKILPGQPLKELDLSHPIFHSVYDLDTKPKVPAIAYALQMRGRANDFGPADQRQVSYSGIHDEHGRLMVLLCHNTDLADGWERADDDAWYAETYSEPLAFPMGVNIVVHTLQQRRDREQNAPPAPSKDES